MQVLRSVRDWGCQNFRLIIQVQTVPKIAHLRWSDGKRCSKSGVTVFNFFTRLIKITDLTLILLMWRIGRALNSIPIYSYIQQDATLHSLFISGNCSTCFGWYFHPSSGAHTTVSTASGICHTVAAICPYRGRVETGLSVEMWVA